MDVRHAHAILRHRPRRWLITGAAGFIGSQLLEELLRLGQSVVGVDDFSTGSPANLDRVQAAVSELAWSRFHLIRATILDPHACKVALEDVEIVLHHAGFPSVGLSMAHPLASHESNVTGTLTLLAAAHAGRVRRFVLASSCSVYGDDRAALKCEEEIGSPLSTYGASKRMAEIYVRLFAERFGLAGIVLRYFNVFGPAQSIAGPCAPVIPNWISRLLRGEECVLHGNGAQTRDFLCVSNIVQANLLAALIPPPEGNHRIYNIGSGTATNLLQLHSLLAAAVRAARPQAKVPALRREDLRAGDIQHAVADISRARRELGYEPAQTLEAGVKRTVEWFAGRASETSQMSFPSRELLGA